LNAVGWDYALLGNFSQTLVYCQQALALQQELGARPGQAATWDSLGYAYHHLERYADAIACYRRGLDLYRQIDDRYNVADVLTHLGDTLDASGDAAAARTAWQEALSTLDRLGHADADRVRTRLQRLTGPRGS
jgi:tetratricopeptide (TPR) repeat protein